MKKINREILDREVHAENSAIVTVITEYSEYDISLVKKYDSWKINLVS